MLVSVALVLVIPHRCVTSSTWFVARSSNLAVKSLRASIMVWQWAGSCARLRAKTMWHSVSPLAGASVCALAAELNRQVSRVALPGGNGALPVANGALCGKCFSHGHGPRIATWLGANPVAV